MRSIVLACVSGLACGCSSGSALDDLAAPDDLGAPADAAAAPDLARAADLAGCGPACGTADFVASGVTLTCPSQLRGTICNQGSAAASTVAAFYYSQSGGPPLPAFDRAQATLICTIAVTTLGPGACTTTGCAPGAGFTGTFPTGDYWMRANDDGQHFPLGAECCTGDDVAGTFMDCTLP
ncbi:MAG TPA: hypothetical protein VFF06_13475 [Polyangia bacterium]|nr:hypothetical protein [Polyangia bacterium]